MPECIETLEVPHEDIMGQILGVLGLRAVALADSVYFPVVPLIDAFKMQFRGFPGTGQIRIPNLMRAHWIHLAPFSQNRTATL